MAGYAQLYDAWAVDVQAVRKPADPPTWIATDGEGAMSLCDECKAVCEKHMGEVQFRRLAG